MRSDYSSVGRQAFGPSSDSLVMVNYKSQVYATKTLRTVIDQGMSNALLHGPRLSGKTTIVNNLSQHFKDDSSIFVIDGAALSAHQIAAKLLADLGCKIKVQSLPELVKLVRVIASHRVRISCAPVLIVENLDQISPSAMQLLCIFAELTHANRPIIQIILTCRDQSRAILAAQEMESAARRTARIINLGPLTSRETTNYLHTRLSAAGVRHPDSVFPLDVCEQLHELSGGWPGVLNQFALPAIERAKTFPVRVVDIVKPNEVVPDDQPIYSAPSKDDSTVAMQPRLIISKDGEMLCDYTLEERKVVIGRSALADVKIDDNYVSKFHALLFLSSNGLMIADLNSSNGTIVNSRLVTTKVLRNSDIISLGHYKIKVDKLPAKSEQGEATPTPSDTAKMKTLDDQRAQQLRSVSTSSDQDKKKA